MSRRTNDIYKLRQSVSFTKEQHDAIAEIAETYNVSFCWVVRYACDLLVQEFSEGQGPLSNLPKKLNLKEEDRV